MKAFFEVRAKLEIDGDHQSRRASVNAMKFNLSCSPNLKVSEYLDDEDLPTKTGSLIVTNVLIQALVGNIHVAKIKGFRDDVDHIKYIVEELTRGFAENLKAGSSTFDSDAMIETY